MEREAPGSSLLHADLVALLTVTRVAERDLFGMLDPEAREARGADGDWSPKDVQAHLAAWRSIEARRLEATASGDSTPAPGDPELNAPVDESNAMLHARSADWSWAAVSAEADASVEALISAIGRSASDALLAGEDTTAGIGAGDVNHAVRHLTDVAKLDGGTARLDAFTAEIESILRRGHVRLRDSGTLLYNIACLRALSGNLDEARRLLRAAFARRSDLAEFATEDPDLAALGDELASLAAARE